MRKTKQTHCPVHFGVFDFDRNGGHLYRDGIRIHLQPQASTLLDLLLDHPNEVVTREEIRNRLWPGQEAGEFDSRINFEVKQIRDALRDDPHNPVCIETIPRLGYRFIGQMNVADESQSTSETGMGTFKNAQDGKPLGRAAWESGLQGRRWFRAFAIAGITSVIMLGTLAVRAHIISRPVITSVTPILPQPNQTIVIRGHGMGIHTNFTNVDTPFLSIRDKTAGWAAGRIVDRNFDEVTLTVASWTDSEIVVTGFGGAYGRGYWRFNPGDMIQIAVWNPQSTVGPTTFDLQITNSSGLQ